MDLDPVNPLSNFIDAERNKYAEEDNNRFAFSLAQAARYYRFVLIIEERHNKLSHELISKCKQWTAWLHNNPNAAPGDAQLAVHREALLLSSKVQLEIETFYVFAKVLLDRLAFFIQDYFGQVHGVSLVSHRRLAKYEQRFQNAKALLFPDGFSAQLQYLTKQICDYRDKQVSHLRNPRSMKLVGFDEAGDTWLATTYLCPNDRDVQIQSDKIKQLKPALDTYVKQVIELVVSNRNKTRFRRTDAIRDSDREDIA